ncbi:MAG: type II toxin-antitoxin system RelE/ParE family toxin [Candidatus Tectomicrobia bacterium]|uniref:Type II toxin-antitoxin system RelE/ParE family toxin n=1 Tax=Tectimicrobiota bacterium TaxID=2528274 RepID=A0A932HWE5_UNCTE|nr:type II toxin-antitoxin system RelE/ParE family toxin [Candidatus Tectomicrobia bacterium]
MRLEFHPEAERELIEAALRYELQVPGLGRRFGVEVRRACDLLLEQPALGHPVEPDLRQFVLDRFPFTLIYSLPPESVRVLAISHHRRRPGYWRSRMLS